MFALNTLLIKKLTQRYNLMNQSNGSVATIPRDCVSSDPKIKNQIIKRKK
jgi:hypothetical protein